ARYSKMMNANDPEGMYSQILRKRQQADMARQQAGRFQGLADTANPSGVVGGGQVAGMGMSQATPMAIDWGGILQKAGGNFMAARKESEASKASTQADEIGRASRRERVQVWVVAQ